MTKTLLNDESFGLNDEVSLILQTISRVIASKFFPTRYSDVVLQVPNKRSWALNCTVGRKNGRLNSGWKKFVQDNNIKVGDVCVFEQVSRTRFLFNVYIFPAVEGV